MSDYRVDYLLTKTVLRLSLDQVLVSDKIHKTTKNLFEGAAELIDVSDPAAAKVIEIPRGSGTNTTSTIKLRPDRRLKSIDATTTGQGPEWVKAGLGVAGTLVGLVVAASNPLAGLAVADSATKLATR